MVTATCQGPDCGVEFKARRAAAKYHADRCRKAAARARAKAAPEPEADSAVDQAGDGADHKPTAESEYGRDVLNAVRADLEKAKCLDSVDGRVAMYLARKSIDPDCKNPAAMFKQMREALDAALESAAAADPTPAPTEPEDEVEKARRAREQKASQAAAR
jgi:hypothetical protein